MYCSKLLFALCMALAFSLALSKDFKGLDDSTLHGPQWQAMTAEQKEQVIASLIGQDHTPGEYYSALQLAEIFIESSSTSFDSVGDDMPKQGLFGLETRKKLIHTVGSIGQFRFVSTKNHPYTGVFTGAEHGYIRLSLAARPDTSQEKGFTPGISLKFLVDGLPSTNLMAMYSLEGQASWNFFLHDLTNHVPHLGPNAPTPQVLIAKKFESASPWPTMLGLLDCAKTDEKGHSVDKPVVPYRLIFHPTKALHFKYPNSTSQSLAEQLVQLAPNTTLYEVYAVDAPLSTKPPQHIGDLITKSYLISSLFGDRGLFFEHQRFDADLKYNPQWEKGAQTEIDTQKATDYYTFPDLPWN